MLHNYDTAGRQISILHREFQCFINCELKGTGINSSQYIFLLNIYKNEGVSQEELSTMLAIDKSATKRAIDNLEEGGFIRRERNTEDKRAYKIYLTEKAFEVKPKLYEALAKWNDIITKGLATEEVNNVLKTLKHMSNNAKGCKKIK